MTDLAGKSCEPCNEETPPVEGDELDELMRRLSERWETYESGTRLRATFSFDDFEGALRFTNRVGEVAEAEGHHPEICVTWGEARVKVWTHAIDALSENDFILAAKIDELRE